MEQTSMNKKYIVRLTPEEGEHLEEFVSKGKRAAYKIKHANILLKADADGPGWSDEAIAESFSVHEHTVRNVRQRFVEHGMNAALERKKQEAPSRKPILDGEKQAHLLATACSQPPHPSSTVGGGVEELGRWESRTYVRRTWFFCEM